MIVCKIISNFQSKKGSFGKLYQSLSELGNVLYAQNALYFGCDTKSCTEKKVKSLLRSAGYDAYFVNVYTQDNPPREDDYINGWVVDQLMRINVKQFTESSQEQFHHISDALDQIEQFTNAIVKNAKEGATNGGRNN